MLFDLLARGYFPKELPPPFTTESFAKLITTYTTALPGDLNRASTPHIKKYPNDFQAAKLFRYSHAKVGRQRRILSLPNPIHFSLLCKEIADNWATLTPLISGSNFSATAPALTAKGRALQGKHPQNRADFARKTRLNNRYILRTDITRCYPSIYTHSIPWAIHTKAFSKKERNALHLGNRLDYWVRMAQDGQTIGIPIGPDTSLLLAELLLHRCDEALSSKLPDLRGHRFIDDYELGFRDRSSAEEAHDILQSCLDEYELALKTEKTEILNLPSPIEPIGFGALRTFSFRPSRGFESSDVQFFFDKMFDLHNTFPSEAYINYGIGRIRNQKHHPDNWTLIESLLLLCISSEPACIPYALELLAQKSNQGFNINKAGIRNRSQHSDC
jgi:Reverse transcriptase (RNA-dependent DNA polymerase)